MSIFVIGINHKTAPVTLREKIYFATDRLSLYLQDLLTRGIVQEAVLLSTCNRSELYCETNNPQAVRSWFCEQAHPIEIITDPQDLDLEDALYCYHEEEAIAHIMTVACGLDSMILGEPQILGQMKEAFAESCTAGVVDSLFHRLFQQVFNVAKEVRTSTAIGACPVSVASAAVHFAKSKTPQFAQANVLLLGAGDTSELLVRYLKTELQNPVHVVNRSVEKAQFLAEKTGGCAYGFDQLALAIEKADVIFTATGSPQPVITKELLSALLPKRAFKPLLLIDIAVPRDIEEKVAELAAISLHSIDDLKIIIEGNRQGREHAATKARELIYNKSKAIYQELISFDKVAHTIRAYRGQIEAICRIELLKAKQQLYLGAEPQTVLESFADAFVKKLMHTPSVQLRQAGAEGRFELLKLAKQLFAISDHDMLIPDPEVERV